MPNTPAASASFMNASIRPSSMYDESGVESSLDCKFSAKRSMNPKSSCCVCWDEAGGTGSDQRGAPPSTPLHAKGSNGRCGCCCCCCWVDCHDGGESTTMESERSCSPGDTWTACTIATAAATGECIDNGESREESLMMSLSNFPGLLRWSISG